MENLDHVTEAARRTEASAEGPMVSQEQWGAIRSMSERGMARKAIARQLGIDVRTVRRYLRRGGRAAYCRSKPVLEALERDHGEYLRQRAPAVQWVAQVLFQEVRARGFRGGYEVIKRWVRPLREEQERIEAATVRFETAGGRQAQADWGTTRVEIAGAWTRIHVFVLTLGFSRRLYVRAYPHERLAALIDGHERAFRHFGGRTEEILYDNPRTIVMRRDLEGRHVEWHPIFRDFANRYGYRPRVCRPYRARTKGKVESGIKYVKGNALRGRSFRSWEHLNDWLEEWATTIADQRVHGTTHERPIDRFAREGLLPVPLIPPYQLERHPSRMVATDCLVNLDTNRYSVPWQLVGQTVAVSVVEHEVRLFHRGELVATHALCTGRHQVIRDPEHYRGLMRFDPRLEHAAPDRPQRTGVLWRTEVVEVEVRDLEVYAAVAAAGGGR